MTENKLFEIMDCLDDALISECADYSPKIKRFSPLKYSAAAACCLLAIGLIYFWGLKDFNIPSLSKDNVTFDSAPLETKVSTDISELFPNNGLADILNNPNVIWGEDGTKEDVNYKNILLGTTLISPRLKKLMENGGENSIYAVLTDFSCCIDENEMKSYNINGENIAELERQLAGFYRSGGENSVYDGSSLSNTQPIYGGKEDELKVAEINAKIQDIKQAYYYMKINSFKDTFKNNGLEIYVCSKSLNSGAYFYTFAAKQQLEDFKAKDNESFVFYLADRLKREDNK